MASIWKIHGRKPIAEGSAEPSLSNWAKDGGLTFRINIGEHKVVLTHVERDDLIAAWTKLEHDFQH